MISTEDTYLISTTIASSRQAGILLGNRIMGHYQLYNQVKLKNFFSDSLWVLIWVDWWESQLMSWGKVWWHTDVMLLLLLKTQMTQIFPSAEESFKSFQLFLWTSTSEMWQNMISTLSQSLTRFSSSWDLHLHIMHSLQNWPNLGKIKYENHKGQKCWI